MSPAETLPAERLSLEVQPLRIGLTGGIASGKSTAAAAFERLGIAIIDADVVAREVIAPGSTLLATVFERFESPVRQRYGASLRLADGALDRGLMRRLVFEDAAQRHALEALLHPAIRERTEVLAAQCGGPYQIHVNPLLVETAARARYHRILVVDASLAAQRARLGARDGAEPALIEAMLAAQTSREQRLAEADDVLHNDGGTAALESQVAQLHQQYLTLALEMSSRHRLKRQ